MLMIRIGLARSAQMCLRGRVRIAGIIKRSPPGFQLKPRNSVAAWAQGLSQLLNQLHFPLHKLIHHLTDIFAFLSLQALELLLNQGIQINRQMYSAPFR